MDNLLAFLRVVETSSVSMAHHWMRVLPPREAIRLLQAALADHQGGA